MWTITHADSDGRRVKTFSYPPHVWATRESAQRYLDALLMSGDLATKIFVGESERMSTMRVSEVGKFD